MAAYILFTLKWRQCTFTLMTFPFWGAKREFSTPLASTLRRISPANLRFFVSRLSVYRILMEKGKGDTIAKSLEKLDLKSISKRTHYSVAAPKSYRLSAEKKTPPSLVCLCLGFVGKHLEELIPDLPEVAASFPPDMKMAVAAIARRRRLLNDNIIVSLADISWETLDVSSSDVSDFGLVKVAEICKYLRAVDISRCRDITADSISQLVKHCNSLETLRCGGCPRSDDTARRCLGIFKPKLNDMEEESWEDLTAAKIADGTQSMRWLVWPTITKESLENFSTECPRISVNPKPSPFGFRGAQVPREALPNITLDYRSVEGIDPKTWAVTGIIAKAIPSQPGEEELSKAEKFRLAFVERDNRLAPKRAKNARQHQRRAERDWMMMNSNAKALALASVASRNLPSRN